MVATGIPKWKRETAMSLDNALVLGAGGFIGSHLVRALKQQGYWVRGVDLKAPQFSETAANDFIVGDLSDVAVVRNLMDRHCSEVYQLAADMGGAGYIFSGENDAEIMRSSALINLNVLSYLRPENCGRVFYSSSACIYPAHNQRDPENPNCSEASAYPAAPDSEYGWEKLFSERLYLAHARNTGLTVRIARFHNIFGPEGTWTGGREKVPAAICRKVAMAGDGDEIEIWGDGQQTRSFLYVDECLDGIFRLTRSGFAGPVNIGSSEMVSINGLVDMVSMIAGKTLRKKHIAGPNGVRGRTSDNRLIMDELGWRPTAPLQLGLRATYRWIADQVEATRLRS
jgi:GDP-D-mannose 3',5'-epimerase